MAQSLVKNYIHLVFSTKHRDDFIDKEIEDQMFRYIATICKDFESPALQIGGTDNHIHILFLLSRKIALMKLVQEVKAHSSKWIKTKGEKYEGFFWQDGYGAFSVDVSNLDIIRKYIINQRKHHQEVDFKKEFITMLENDNVEYNDKYLWD